MDRIDRKIGTVNGILTVCETDLASLYSQSVFLASEIEKSDRADWDDSEIETFLQRLYDLQEKLSKVEAALGGIPTPMKD